MASFGHVAIGLAAGRLFVAEPATTRALARAMLGFSALSLLPDADVIAFALGVPYGAPFGHRGASHSLVAALSCGLVAWWAASRARSSSPPLRLGIFVALVVATHGLLDAMTDGGRGVALLFPFSAERLFLPWRPIPVAPIGARLLSPRGLSVLAFELVAFAPLVAYALVPRFWRRGISV